MKANELRQKSPNELRRLAADLRSQLRDLRFKVATRQHTKVRTLREMKKDISRIETILAAKDKQETKTT